MGISLLENSLGFERVGELPEHRVLLEGRKNGEVVCIASCRTTAPTSHGVRTAAHLSTEAFLGNYDSGDGQ